MADDSLQYDSALYDDQPQETTVQKALKYGKTLGRRFLFGPTPEETGAKEAGLGEVQGPGFMEFPGARKLAERVRTTGRESGDYWKGFQGSIYGDLIDMASTGFDPRTVGIKPIPRLDPVKFEAELAKSKAAYEQAGLTKKPLALPPAENPTINTPQPTKPTFFQGRAGVTDASKTYPMDIGPINPSMADVIYDTGPKPGDTGVKLPQDISGTQFSPSGRQVQVKQGIKGPATVLPQELGEVSRIPPIYAAEHGTNLGRVGDIEPTIPGIKRAMEFGGQVPEVPREQAPINEISSTDRNYQEPPRGEAPTSGARKFGKYEPSSVQYDEATTEGGSGNSTSPIESKGSPIPKINPEIPKPGEATVVPPKGKDIGHVKANLSVDRALNSKPETQPIVTSITQANDQKLQWVATQERRASDLLAGLGKDEIETFYDMLNGDKVDPKYFYLQPRVQEARAMLDEAWNKVPGAVRGEGSSIGYLQDYITHIEKDPDIKAAIQQILEFHKNPKGALDRVKELLSRPEMPGMSKVGNAGDMLGTSLGNPSSKFAETRTGGITNLQKDLRRVFPIYIESLGKLIFDKPAVAAAKDIISKLPERNVDNSPNLLRETAEWYVKNYTRYDSAPGLSQAWRSLGESIRRTVSRSMLGLSPGLQSLHLARIPGNLLPELPTKYVGVGLQRIISDPSTVASEAGRLGLLPNEIRPWRFKTPGEKVDTIIHLNSYIDAIDRLMGYYGFKQQLIDQGVPEAQASIQALGKTKTTGLSVDPARPIKLYSPDRNAAGEFWRFATQFHQVPTKIVEQYVDIANKIKTSKDPNAAARAIVGIGSAMGLTYGLGIKAFHLRANQFFPDLQGGASIREMGRVYNFLAKGNVQGALEETALLLTPAGKSIEGQIRRGEPSFFESDSKAPRLPTR